MRSGINECGRRRAVLAQIIWPVTLKAEEEQLTAQEVSLSADRENTAKALSEKRVALDDFEQFMATFKTMDIKEFWIDATEDERKIVLSNYFEKILFFRDRVSVKMFGLPAMVMT